MRRRMGKNLSYALALLAVAAVVLLLVLLQQQRHPAVAVDVDGGDVAPEAAPPLPPLPPPLLLARHAVTRDDKASVHASDGRAVWARVEELRLHGGDAAATTTCVPRETAARWRALGAEAEDLSQAVVRAYVAGPRVFAAAPVWTARHDTVCVVLPRAVRAREAPPLQVVFVMQYRSARASLEVGVVNGSEVSLARARAQLAVVPVDPRDGQAGPAPPLSPSLAPSLSPSLAQPYIGGAWRVADEAAADPELQNCTSLHGVHAFHLCTAPRSGFFAPGAALAHVPVPDGRWLWHANNAGEHATYTRAQLACLQRTELFVVGDSLLRQLAQFVGALRAHDHVHRCSVRRMPPSSHVPAVHHVMARKLQDTSPEQLQLFLDHTRAPWEPRNSTHADRDVLVVSSGHWNTKDTGCIDALESMFRVLLDAIRKDTRYSRVVVTTVTAVQVLNKPDDGAKTRITSTRGDAINLLLRKLVDDAADERISLLDWSAVSAAAPWGTVPGDAVHYCNVVHAEHAHLLFQHVCP